MSRQSFIQAAAPYAVEVGTKNHVLPSVILAQAILESGNGESGLAIKGHNLFGVKGSYHGESVTMPTREYVNGEWVSVESDFRKYPTWAESFSDLCELYKKPRYQAVLGETDYIKACHAIKDAGYATDPNYPNLLIGIIQHDNLTQFDAEEAPAHHTVPKGENVYTVQSGDTLSEIAAAHDTTVALLMQLNPSIKDKDLIFPGQVLRVGQATKAPETENKPDAPKKRVYVVKKNDTFSEIAAALYPDLNPYKGGIDKLHGLNPQIKHIGSLSVGEVINY